ncbi:uncharacterized protein LOC103723583 [Phoenix dactylifera]|uniref:Uncharacterized protein LOC103723583 n=1 Tax=Phoenix dactylifera TaxID=42345 RepID=A0A8B7D4P1_PHODC|nr:uncharacterized protein LOC103723583 [Phoenix dactylifera]XP_008812762.2 uncharacterized protein LOC103723583 [Phoenix dactylifera]
MMKSMEEDEVHERPAELPAENRTRSPPRPRLSQSRLHNFSFPTLSWGRHKLLRCMNLNGGAAGENAGSVAPATAQHDTRAGQKRPVSSSSPDKSRPPWAPPEARDSKEADERSPEEGEGEESSSSAAAAAAAAMRPWNLRTRRAACSAPGENGWPRNPNSAAGPSSPPAAENSNLVAKPVRLRSDSAEKGERRKFAISLSREEIEEDFLLFKGTKPPRRPKKRQRIAQKQLDSLFPGLWLSEVTLDSYKIDE